MSMIQPGEDLDEGVIEVQVIPQDDNWGETATTITETATSYVTSIEDLDTFDDVPKEPFSLKVNFKRIVSVLLSVILGLLAVGSPIAFIILPIALWKTNTCGALCNGLFISFGAKQIVLLVGVWALYVRPFRANTPRVNVLKMSVMVITLVVVICYWLFYGWSIMSKREHNFFAIANFALSFTDCMLFLHYLSLVLLWIRNSDPVFTVKVIRNTDGFSRYYNIGRHSLQGAAVFLLERYYRDFPLYNPHLERHSASRANNQKRFSGLKFYDIDGKGNDNTNTNATTRAVIAASSGRRQGRNDRFYEEAEFDKRIKKRRARLYVAAEEAFGHVARLGFEKQTDGNTMDPEEAAQAVFPSLARPLQKYLKTTRQQPRFTMESIIKHLAHCISHDLAPRAFLERYVNEQPSIAFMGPDRRAEWVLVSEDPPSREIKEGTVFILRRDDISIVITVQKIPTFSIQEEMYDYDSDRFVLRLNSETSV